jgi:general L-amino acid transport system substrate-binding protein
MFMSTEFEIGNLLPRFCRLAFNRILLAQITNGLLGSCAVTAVFIGSFVVTLSATAGTLDDVRSRGKLICGVSEGLPGFSEKDGSGAWQGFDVDFCKAVAAAVLGDTAKVEYVPLSATVRFDALTDRRIDLLSRNSTWTMSRDLELGIDFAGVSYFDGQGFLVPTLFGASSALQLDGARICVATGTTSEQNATEFFQSKNLKVTFLRFNKWADARAAYAAEKCDVFTGDRSALAAERSLLPTPQNHVILRDVISKEPLGPMTRKDDPKWTGLVRWTLFALINAEELGLNMKSIATDQRQQAIALGAPATKSLGLADDWLVKVIGGVGNYSEIFERNLGENTPLNLSRGINALWTQGGLLYAPPMQ